jgi:sugar/nucleoside kinase (ribokinase family)
VANEVDPGLVRAFPDSMICLTPQGWMRSWDKTGRISFGDWPEAGFVLEHSTAAILSVEDVHRNETYIEEFSSHIRILAITEGPRGCRVYWNGDVRHFSAPKVTEVDSTGAGDIFAAAFFTRLYTTHDPWEAGRFATLIASNSVTRHGLQSVPTPEEIQNSLTEIVEKP